MVIDVDEVVLLQASEARAGHAVAFENDGGVSFRRLSRRPEHRFREGKRTVDGGNAVAQYHRCLFTHAAKNLRAGEGRANGVAVLAARAR